ncbi:hypothetical protein [Nocardioides sp. cx-173]|uniref:hypothetical protein n=1 Tax=Nocardioides sp. cx-173 TaxID=2898796 RepID=UPI001E5D03F8|nr:hypothetical protein [Nocardioides sp. cx-173]MCD4524898.1 hypothetical protein [Nocardioides sp. cx-173]UGB43401.1 hypothetical protein LQ940_07690 [Nocardioides sp. cx-173]
MTPDETGALVLALLAAGAVAAAWGWTPAGRSIWPPASLAVLAAALATAVPAELEGETPVAVGVALAGLLAIAGGGPVTAWVFAFVDRQGGTGAQSMQQAEEVLRGGAWIGGLERAAVAASLMAGWPEGVAISLALKGLGRYPELRNQENTGTAERFIIGTFTSVLWASACAGVVLLAT